MTIDLDHAAFRAATTDVRGAADRLRTDRARITREVDELLDGGWAGAAADAYAEGWSEWTDASRDVLAGLDAMASLLVAVHADLSERDADSQQRLDEVSAAIVARLG